MSCPCQNIPSAPGESFVCPCDRFAHPPVLRIGAGLQDLPRQIAGFPEFRRAMLYALRHKAPLRDWQATGRDDLGLMLLEMWAYLCDSLAFYDKVIARETYLRTAMRAPSLRRLVALTGYLPRPAVAATVQLAALADGRLPVTLPDGTAFRSSSPAQVFELEEKTVIHPLTNSWKIQAPHPMVILSDNLEFLLIQAQTALEPDSILLLINKDYQGQTQTLHVKKVSLFQRKDGRRYTKVEFTPSAQLVAGTPLSQLQLMMPTQSAALWTASNAASVSQNTVTLDSIYKQFSPDDYVLISKGKSEWRWYQVTKVVDEPQ